MNDANTNDANDPCGTFGPDVVALLRGELSAADEGPVRAHLAGCPACTALAAAYPAIRSAAAGRVSPAPSAASRVRLAAALDGALAEADARDRARGPVLRLVDRAARRYAESRRVRFLTYSLALHAAAAVLLTVHVVGRSSTGEPAERFVEIGSESVLPPLYPDDPLVATGPMPGGPNGLPFRNVVDLPYPALNDPPGHGLPTPPVEDPVDGGSSFRLYPTNEFASIAGPRFRRADREKRLVGAYGPDEGPRVGLTVDRGLRYLAAAQDPDGTWGSGHAGDPAAHRDRLRGGVTGTVALAFMGDGRTALRRGPYADLLRPTMQKLLRSADPATGLLGTFTRGAANDRPLCNHAPALAALAEEYSLDFGLLPETAKREMVAVIERGVAATLKAQLADGSFGYAPGARQGDSSVTLLQVEALEACRRAGFAVEPGALRKAGEWLTARIGADGRLGYRTAGDREKDATLTAAALPLARGLALPDAVRERMLSVIVDEARAAPLGDRILFRAAVLEAVAGSADEAARALAPVAARSGTATQTPGGAIRAERDPYATAAGDALATARTLRALTAPYRASR